MTYQAERDATRPHFWRWWRWWLLAAIGLLILMKAGVLPEKQWWVSGPLQILWLVTLLVMPVVFLFRNDSWSKKYNAREKSEGVAPAIRFLVPEFEYRQSQHVPGERVRASRILESWGDIASIDGDDCFTGMIGKTAVEFSEVRLAIRDRTARDDKGNPVMWHCAGMFLVADFNKPFQHATLVMPDPLEQKLGKDLSGFLDGAVALMNSLEKSVRRGGAPGPAAWRPVRLENLEFERLFKVYGTDPVEAHYILTPDIMERVTAFQKGTRFAITLSFIGTAMHAFIPRGALFEGDVAADRTDFSAYQAYYEQLRQIFDLVDAMNLNTRLWGKA